MRSTFAALAGLTWLCTSSPSVAQPTAHELAPVRAELRTEGLFTSAQIALLFVRRASRLGRRDQGIGYTGSIGWGFTRSVAVLGSFDSHIMHTWGDSLDGGTYVPTFGVYRFQVLGIGVRLHGALTPTTTTYLSTSIGRWSRPFAFGTAAAMAGGVQLFRIPGVALDVGVDYLQFVTARPTGTTPGHRPAHPASGIRLRAGATYWHRSHD